MKPPPFAIEERRARRAAARERIAALRLRVRQAIAAKREHMRAIVAVIRVERVALRERLRADRKRTLEELRDAARAELANARTLWTQRKREAKEQATSAVARERAELAAARALERTQRQIKQAHRADAAAHARGPVRPQTDDEVRALIPHELVPLFERVKESVRGGRGQTRADAFLEYAERHPEEAYKIVEPLGEKQLQRTIDELEEATRNAARGVAVAPLAVRPRTPRRVRTVASPATTCDCPHEAEESATKDAIRTAHDKIRKQRRALENQERRFERGDYGKQTRAEMWHRLAEGEEQVRLAEQAVVVAEAAFQAKYGRPYWEVGAS